MCLTIFNRYKKKLHFYLVSFRFLCFQNKKLLNANRRRLPEDFRETSQTYHNDVNSKYQGSNYDNQISSYQGREKDSNYDPDYQVGNGALFFFIF